MKTSCKNCNNPTKNNYCDICGQSTKTDRINFHYLIGEFQHSVLHVDKGIFYTIKELLYRPGSMIEGYLTGERVKHFKPFAFVIIIATIYGFLGHYLHLNIDILPEIQNGEDYRILSNNIYELIYSHYSLFMLLSVPLFGLSTYILFRKNGYNYFEHLILNSYIIGIQILISIFFTPLVYVLSPNTYINIAFILSTLYTIWAYNQFFSKEFNIVVLIKSVIANIISILFFIIIGATGSIIYFVLKHV